MTAVDEFFRTKNMRAAKTMPAMVTFLLDESSPMLPQKESTITAFRAYTNTLSAVKDKAAFSLYKFNTSLTTLTEAEPISDALNSYVTAENYRPRDGMHLIDCTVAMLHRLEDMLKQHNWSPRMVICLNRDAEDTSARPWQILNKVMERKQSDGWQFQLLGCACTDPYRMATRMGLDQRFTISYDALTAQTAFERSAAITCDYLNGRRSNVAYLESDRQLVKDRFAPPHLIGRTTQTTQRITDEDTFEDVVEDSRIAAALTRLGDPNRR